ncbi:MAG TPA: DUF72 domain-containing protein [Terriglobales bacterium]|nr:DUF72 domain-containing protein [Terriglobales bacterium]
MATLHTGTSGWAYASWKPAFYPPKLPQKSFLNYYATRLNAVEVNYTFRHMASEKSLQNWIAETPAEFRFCLKAHQAITHIGRLKNTEELVKRFLASLEPLLRAGKLGPALFQLPPNFKADAALLNNFLDALPKALCCAFEFRHQSWFSDAVYDTLRRHNAALCVAESEDMAVPDVCTANFCYYRLRKPEYSAEERGQIADKMRAHLGEGRDAFVFFKHEDTPEGALYAAELLQSSGAPAEPARSASGL